MDNEVHYLKKELYQLLEIQSDIFDFIQEVSLDGLWYWDLENPENEWMNDKFWQVLGYNPADRKHLAAEWQNIIHPEDLKLAITNFNKHCENPSHPYDQVVRYTHQNGSTVWIRCRGMAIRNEQGKPIRMLGAHTDITKLKEIELKYRRNLKELDKTYALTKLAFEESEMLFDLAPDANLKMDIDGNIVKANQQAASLFGYAQEELMLMNVNDLLPEDMKSRHKLDLKNYFKTGGVRKMGQDRGKLKLKIHNGELITVEITLNLIDTAYGKRALATIRDVSEVEHLISSLQQQIDENKKLSTLTILDPLTKIFNRRYFDESFEREFQNAKRYQHQLSLMVLDIDWFKQVNDQHGHNIGNLVLEELATFLNGLIRHGDMFARIGGEEFAIILPHTDAESAIALADRMVFEVDQHQFKVGENVIIPITVSIGVATFDEKISDDMQLFEAADSALYQSKNQGRNCAKLFRNLA